MANILYSIPLGSVKRFFQIIFAPWPSTYEPIKSLLNAPTAAEKDLLTATWRDRKLAELSFVGITCGLVAGVISAAFSWQPVDDIPWSTAGLWYGALLMNLTSICLATQQGVSLNRLSGYSDSLSKIRNLLGSTRLHRQHHITVTPHWDQLYVWQTPIMLLNGASSGRIGISRSSFCLALLEHFRVSIIWHALLCYIDVRYRRDVSIQQPPKAESQVQTMSSSWNQTWSSKAPPGGESVRRSGEGFSVNLNHAKLAL